MKGIILKDKSKFISLEDVKSVDITRDAYEWKIEIGYWSGYATIYCGTGDKGKMYADKCFEKICGILLDKS